MRSQIIPRPNRRLQSLLVCVFWLFAASSSSYAWWNTDWTIRKKITVDTTAKGVAITDPIGAAVVLIRLHDGDFQFSAAKEDGSDLRLLAADDKTELTYHIEKFDPLLDEAFVWVRLPDVKPSAQTSFWLYYGNTKGKAERQENAKGTYDSDTVLVYHFNEHGAPAADASAGGNNSEKAGVAVDGSMIGTGLRLDGTSEVTIPPSPTLALADGAALTWSAWVKPAALTPNAVIYSRRDGPNAFVVGFDNGVPFAEVSGPAGAQRTGAGTPVTPGSWHHLAVTVAGSDLTLYLDGVSYAKLSASVPALNAPAIIGTDPSAAGVEGQTGEMDELEISRVARPAGAIMLAAATQGGEQAGKALQLGADEVRTSWLSGGGTMAVLIGSLTVDGWIVIIILAFMAVMSWFVMFSKIRYLNAISKGNALFMKEWKHVAADLTALDDADAEQFITMGGRVDQAGQRAMRNASVYRIYHIGVEEIRHRLAEDNTRDGRRKGLAGRSIQAIRASLDGGLVRETQKINKLIVLLTICISGGPFLGLLGTVVGVMITFAAIAAAGDVNVNAIAPGIAAALLATVAGLAVAIPSLFGYNYIVSRVKDAKDDMAIFIDEFVTKMAEFYRETPETYRERPELYQESAR